MKVSLPDRSVISSLFKDEPASGNLFFKQDEEDKRRRLACERRAEYNTFLEKKEKEGASMRKASVEMSTPRSILESVDYEKLLAKRKEEEFKFRNLNNAAPNLDESFSRPMSFQEDLEYISEAASRQSEEVPNQFRKVPSQFSNPGMSNRTGGGGDPVKDSFGNLITARGYKHGTTSLGFPSFEPDLSKSKVVSYREELRKQIEEKKHLESLERRKAELLEEQISRRIEQQRLQMLKEYESELHKSNRLKEQRQQERVQKLEEFQRRDAALRSKKTKESRPIESPEDLPDIKEPKRSPSPPVPSVRSKVILERVPSVTTHVLAEVKPENIFSSLAEIRRTIMQDQQNLKKDFKDSYEVMNRRTVKDVVDDYDEDIKQIVL